MDNMIVNFDGQNPIAIRDEMPFPNQFENEPLIVESEEEPGRKLSNDVYDNSEETEENGSDVHHETHEEQEEEIIDNKTHKGKIKGEKVSFKTQFNRLQREKFQAIEEARIAKEEVEALRRRIENADAAAMKHFDDNIDLRIRETKKIKALAIENGDIEAQAEADLEFAKLAVEHANTNAWKNSQEFQKKNLSQQPQNEYNVAPHVHSWVEKNSWMNPQSEDYDYELADRINEYSEDLNLKLSREGQSAQIMSPAYFREIDRYANKVRSEYEQEPEEIGYEPRRQLQMKPSKNYVSPVNKGGSSSTRPSSREIKLDQEQRQFIRTLGIPEKEFIKQIQRQSEDDKRRGVN